MSVPRIPSNIHMVRIGRPGNSMNENAPARKEGGKGSARNKNEIAITIEMKATSTEVGTATCNGTLACGIAILFATPINV